MKINATSYLRNLLLVTFGVLLFNVAMAASNSPVGYWKQISDKDGKAHSIVKIYKVGNTLSGKIVAGYRVNGKLPKQYCTKCSGKLKNKQILGMNIVTGMQYVNGRWERGHILDPDSGDLYKSIMTLENGGNKLSVRGYIGISLFGRSQTWLRIPPSQVKAAMSKALTKVMKK